MLEEAVHTFRSLDTSGRKVLERFCNLKAALRVLLLSEFQILLPGIMCI